MYYPWPYRRARRKRGRYSIDDFTAAVANTTPYMAVSGNIKPLMPLCSVFNYIFDSFTYTQVAPTPIHVFEIRNRGRALVAVFISETQSAMLYVWGEGGGSIP